MIAYLIKTMLCAALFFGAYHLLLAKEKMHRFNRWYLLFSLILSFIIPFVTLQIHNKIAPYANPVTIASATYDVFPSAVIQQTPFPQTAAFDPFICLLIIYGFITVFLLFRFVKNLFNLLSKIKHNRKVLYGNATLVLMQNETEPHSFLRYIFLNKTEYERGDIPCEILQHELAHVEQRHSLDILFIELLTAVLWFNPFLFLYKKAVRLNHEFLADEAVINLNTDVHNYQLLLLQKASGRSVQMTNHFNYFITKKRLIMLTKTTSGATAVCRQIIVLLCIVTTVFFLSKKSFAQNKTDDSTAQKNKEIKKSADSSKVPAPKTFIWGNTIGFTKEGATDELMNEYKTLVNKYLETDTSGRKSINRDIEPADRKRMEQIVKQMNKEQQSKQEVMFVKPSPPLRKKAPTQKQIDAFKNPKAYGVWIDDKKVNNKVLANYINTDFSSVFISNLYGAAKRNVTYNQQVNLMTNKYYQKDYDEAMKHKDESILVVVQVFAKNKTSIHFTNF